MVPRKSNSKKNPSCKSTVEKNSLYFSNMQMICINTETHSRKKKPSGITQPNCRDAGNTLCSAHFHHHLLPRAEQKEDIQLQGGFPGHIWLPKQCAHTTFVTWHTACHVKTRFLHGFSLSKLILKRRVLIQELLVYVCIESALSSQMLPV